MLPDVEKTGLTIAEARKLTRDHEKLFGVSVFCENVVTYRSNTVLASVVLVMDPDSAHPEVIPIHEDPEGLGPQRAAILKSAEDCILSIRQECADVLDSIDAQFTHSLFVRITFTLLHLRSLLKPMNETRDFATREMTECFQRAYGVIQNFYRQSKIDMYADAILSTPFNAKDWKQKVQAISKWRSQVGTIIKQMLQVLGIKVELEKK